MDRRRELGWLEEKWESGRAELLLVYGRRRIGKTRLLGEWSRGKDVFYFVADEAQPGVLLERLSLELADYTGDELLRERPFTGWRQVFLYIAEAASRNRLGFVMDEFQYAVYSSPELPSVIQALWDTRLRATRAFIVLMGSIVSFAEGILSQKSPLYGRLTGVLRLREMGPLETRCFVPNWAPEDALGLYGVFGGVPGYLVEVDPSLGLWENVERLVLSPNARFIDEAKLLLKEELREVSRYYSILEAIAGGATGYGEIASKSGVPAESLSKYLRVLEEMGLVERQVPVLGRARARYRVADRFLEFWFRYVPRHRSAIELGLGERVVRAVRRDFEQKVLPRIWEEAVGQAIGVMASKGLLPLTPSRMGPWWHRGEEIDIVAVDETGEKPRILVVEAKWAKLGARDVRRILDRLRAKAAKLPVERAEYYYMVAAREAEGRPELLSNEHLLTLSDTASLAQELC